MSYFLSSVHICQTESKSSSFINIAPVSPAGSISCSVPFHPYDGQLPLPEYLCSVGREMASPADEDNLVLVDDQPGVADMAHDQ